MNTKLSLVVLGAAVMGLSVSGFAEKVVIIKGVGASEKKIFAWPSPGCTTQDIARAKQYAQNNPSIGSGSFLHLRGTGTNCKVRFVVGTASAAAASGTETSNKGSSQADVVGAKVGFDPYTIEDIAIARKK